MTSSLPVVLGALVVLGLALWLILVAHRAEKRRREAYLALAERRSWDYDFVRSRGNQPAEVRFTDTASGIGLVVTRKLTRKSGSTTTTKGGATVVHLREPRLSGGLAIYTPPLDAKLAQAASTMLGMLDNGLGRFLAGRLLGEEYGNHIGQLVEQPAPEGVAVSILATVDPAPLVDASLMARALQGMADDKAMAMVSETGTRLRLGRALYDVDEIERLFDLALLLQGELRSAQRLSS